MRVSRETIFGLVIWTFLSCSAMASEPLRVALPEPASAENAALLLALQRAERAGIALEVIVLPGEEAVFDAVTYGVAEIGVGTPYAEILKARPPFRVVFQLTRLSFFPVALAEYERLEDLDGVPILLHAPGSGTDAIATAIEKRLGINFASRDYIEGSENRVVAMMTGAARATIVDLPNRDLILSMAPEDFRALPMFEIKASDEVLFVGLETLRSRKETVETLVRIIDQTWHDLLEAPEIVGEELAHTTLAGPLTGDIREKLKHWMRRAVEAGVFPKTPDDVDGPAAADLEWYLPNLSDRRETIGVEQFWDFGPMRAAHSDH